MAEQEGIPDCVRRERIQRRLGKEIIRKIFGEGAAARVGRFWITHNMDLGGKITSGVGLWLNTQFPDFGNEAG
jgi:hypothetical protein